MVARFANLFSQERWKASRHGIARTQAFCIFVDTAVRYRFVSGGSGEEGKHARTHVHAVFFCWKLSFISLLIKTNSKIERINSIWAFKLVLANDN